MIREYGLKTEFLMIEYYKKMTVIEYWDTGKIARDKINAIMEEVEASIPSIWDNWNWYIWGVDTWITAVWIKLREINNLIKQDTNHEAYVDLQLWTNITTTSSFPIWVCVGDVSENNWWIEDWFLLNMRTENNYVRVLYWNSWKVYFDWWLWVFKSIATNEDVNNAVNELRNELHTVAYSGKSSDLDNDYWFSAVPILTREEYDNIPWTAGDDKEYLLYENINR